MVVSGVNNVMSQYNWHLNESDLINAFVFLPIIGSERQPHIGDFVQHLADFSDAEILRRQEYISKIAFKIQYSMPPDATSRDIPGTNVTLPPWSPPFPDAVDVILENMFDKDIVLSRLYF